MSGKTEGLWLEFIKTLSEDNQKKKGEEQKAIGEQAHLVHIKMFQDLERVLSPL